MAIRPVDLQQMIASAPDVARTPSVQQQQAAVAQQLFASELHRHEDQNAEKVQRAEEQHTAAIHERDARSDGQANEEDEEREPQQKPGQTVEDLATALQISRQVGRTIDIKI